MKILNKKCIICGSATKNIFLGFDVCEEHQHILPSKLIEADRKNPNSKYNKINKKELELCQKQQTSREKK